MCTELSRAVDEINILCLYGALKKKAIMFKKSLNYNESLNVVDVIVKRVFMIIL